MLNSWGLHLGLIYITVWSNTSPLNCWAITPGQFFYFPLPKKIWWLHSFQFAFFINRSNLFPKTIADVTSVSSWWRHQDQPPWWKNVLGGSGQFYWLELKKNLIGFLKKLGPRSFWRCRQHGGWQCWFKRFQASRVQIPRGAGDSSGRVMVYYTNCPGFKSH